jgi:hypothetical protein
MNPALSRTDFDQLLAQQRRLIELTNELEYCLYTLGEVPPAGPVQACRRTAGVLVAALRDFLFRQDQRVLPVLDELSRPDAAGSGHRGRVPGA